MRIDRNEGFKSLVLGKDSIVDPEITGKRPFTPIESRLRSTLESDNSNSPLAQLMAEKIISTGIYTTPMSFSEFSKLKYQMFKTLARLNRESVLHKKQKSRETYKLLSAFSQSVGLLSQTEIGYSCGHGRVLTDTSSYLLREDYAQYYETSLKSGSEIGPLILNDQDTAVKMASQYRHLGFIVCIDFGTFDMIHEGHQDTAARAKAIFGPNVILMIGVSPQIESEIIKSKAPKRNQSRRVRNMSYTKGVNIVFPISVPDYTQTKPQLIDFYSDLHIKLGAHIRISGNPITTDRDLLEIYRRQCNESTTLFLLNDYHIDVSSTNDAQLGQN